MSVSLRIHPCVSELTFFYVLRMRLRYNSTDLCWCKQKSCKYHRTEFLVILWVFMQPQKFQGKIIVLRIRILLTPHCKSAGYSVHQMMLGNKYIFLSQPRMLASQLSLFHTDLTCNNVFHIIKLFRSWGSVFVSCFHLLVVLILVLGTVEATLFQ